MGPLDSHETNAFGSAPYAVTAFLVIRDPSYNLNFRLLAGGYSQPRLGNGKKRCEKRRTLGRVNEIKGQLAWFTGGYNADGQIKTWIKMSLSQKKDPILVIKSPPETKKKKHLKLSMEPKKRSSGRCFIVSVQGETMCSPTPGGS